jgi:hypothetical protein
MKKIQKIRTYGSWLVGALMFGALAYLGTEIHKSEYSEGMTAARRALAEYNSRTRTTSDLESITNSSESIPTRPLSTPVIPVIKLETIKTEPLTPKMQRLNDGFTQNQTYTNQTRVAQIETNTPVISVPGKIDNLISDDFFQDSNYLTETQIKSLLQSKGSYLSKVGAEKTIAQASRDYQINPLVILGRLQTEQGLVAKRNVTKNQLKHATGYGVFDNGRRLPSSGLKSQIMHAAEGLREHFNAFYGQKVKIDYGKRIITPKNAATYSSLKYTPHTQGATLNARIVKNYESEVKNKFKNNQIYAQAPINYRCN